MSEPRSEVALLRERLERLERRHRRLRRVLVVAAVAAVLATAVVLHYHAMARWAQPGLTTGSVALVEGAEVGLSPVEYLTLLTGGNVSKDSVWTLRGSLGSHDGEAQLLLVSGRRADGTNGLASLGTMPGRGAALSLEAAHGRVALGTSLYDGDTMLELGSADGRSYVRLGIDSTGAPVFEVAQDGRVQPLLPAGRPLPDASL